MTTTRARKAMAAFATAALASVALAGPLQAQPTDPEAPPGAEVDEGFVCDIDLVGFEEFDNLEDFEEWTPTPEELARLNAETDALIAMLAENGITVGTETDELGFTYPALDETTNNATWDLVDQYYENLYSDLDEELGDFEQDFEDFGPELDVDGCELDGLDFEDWTPTPEELAELNAETDALIAMLAENGITVGTETDELGFTYPALDETTNNATWDLVDQYYENLYGDLEDEFGDFEDFEGEPHDLDEPGQGPELDN